MSARALPPEGRWRQRTLAILGVLAIVAVILLVPLSQGWIHVASPTSSLYPGDGLLRLEGDYVPGASRTLGVTAYVTVTPSSEVLQRTGLAAQQMALPRASLELPAGFYEIDGYTVLSGIGPTGVATSPPEWDCTQQVVITEGQTLTVSMTYDVGTCTLDAR